MAQNIMYPGIDNSPKTTLSATIAASETTIAVDSTTVFPPPPNLATIGTGDTAEVILYNGFDGASLTGCIRGVGGTARVWSAGTNIYRAYTNKDHQTFIDNINDLESRKLAVDDDGSDLTIGFTAAEQKTNIATGDKLSVIAGKIAKWFSLFGSAAWLDTGAEDNKVAAGLHASQHKKGGADALSPSDIGAAPEAQGVPTDGEMNQVLSKAENGFGWRSLTEVDDAHLSARLLANAVRQNAWELEQGTVKLTNTAIYPFNNSEVSIPLSIARESGDYVVHTDVIASSGNVGEVVTADKLTNGFKLSFTGSAESATVKYSVMGGYLK